MELKAMDKENVDPRIFTWTVKVGTAIITFMAGILVYMHRKLHEMDKAFAINEERDVARDNIIKKVEATLSKIDGKLDKTIEMFNTQEKKHNALAEEFEDLKKLRKIN